MKLCKDCIHVDYGVSKVSCKRKHIYVTDVVSGKVWIRCSTPCEVEREGITGRCGEEAVYFEQRKSWWRFGK